MKSVTIIPYAGLGNRMRAISSGIFISQKLNANAIIYWNKTQDCYANFCDLFKPIIIPHITLIENTILLNKIPTKKNLYIPLLMQKLYYSQCIYNFNKNTNGDILNFIKKDTNLLLSSCHSMSNHYKFGNLFIPTDEIQTEISDLTNNFHNNTIGVHIRRTDNINSIKQSSNKSFIKKLDYELNLNSETNFYLATDDIYVKEYFLKIYGDKIITCWDKINRNTLKGMKSAVKDLYCLSKTKKIIGSAYSSYSEIAAELGNISLEIAK